MWTAGNELQAAQQFFKFLGCPGIFFKSAQSFSQKIRLSLSLSNPQSLSITLQGRANKRTDWENLFEEMEYLCK
jgi:hypothetical protein